MRGKDYADFDHTCKNGITPAYAGKSTNLDLGELGQRGSPPPMRGKDFEQSEILMNIRITPAYAGKRWL